MKAHGGCGCKGPHIHITKKLERGMMVASPTVGSFTSGESTGTLFIVGGVDPRISLDTKERRKISNLRNPGSNPTHLDRSEVPCRLSYLANAISLWRWLMYQWWFCICSDCGPQDSMQDVNWPSTWKGWKPLTVTCRPTPIQKKWNLWSGAVTSMNQNCLEWHTKALTGCNKIGYKIFIIAFLNITGLIRIILSLLYFQQSWS